VVEMPMPVDAGRHLAGAVGALGLLQHGADFRGSGAPVL
jgi:hypothetical protein